LPNSTQGKFMPKPIPKISKRFSGCLGEAHTITQ